MDPNQLKYEPIDQKTHQDHRQGNVQSDLVIDFGEFITSFVINKWFILSIIIISIMLGTAVYYLSPPIYRAESLIQIEKKSSGMEMLEALQPIFGDDTNISAEVEILASRMILGKVVDKLKLDIEVSSVSLPLVGKAIIRQYEGKELAPAWLNLTSYAWGGEKLQIDSLDVPDKYLDMPLILVVGEKNEYALFDQHKYKILNGASGNRVSKNEFSIFVAEVNARTGNRFLVTKLSEETALNDLRDHLNIKEQGVKSGILKLSITGSDRDKIVNIVDEIQNTYLRLNVEHRSAQAEKTLKFLQKQLPILKQQVDDAEAAYNNYRQSRGSLDLNLETQGVLASIIDVEDATLKLKQEREELRQRFTEEHPTIQAVDAQLARLNDRQKQFNREIANLPDTQQTILQLARDLEVSTNLYTELLNTVQQLKISKAGTVGDVRIIDSASVSQRPIGPGLSLILTIALILGTFASVLFVVLRRSLQNVVNNPEEIEEKLGFTVYATVPHSHTEALKHRRMVRGKLLNNDEKLLALIDPGDSAVESLRSLRTSLHFALLDTPHKSVLITSSSPGAGKSFLVTNLGIVLAQMEKRIVIVDADLRRGHINKEFNLKRHNGLSEYLSGQLDFTNIIKHTSVPNLSVITTGELPPDPSELLMNSRFENMLNELRNQFDVLVIDSPPILAVSDAAIIGQHTAVTLIAARAGNHSIPELEEAIKRFRHAGSDIKGFVFNDLDFERQQKRHGYRGYVYQYSYH
jgi:tyrosine-protein kinase Etk/Wzc